jgi:hypothetical protein|tara:strand:+ start:461 stop:967 length:507 start_codon:yes stop_codon:yes gene_type:complete
MNGILMQNTLLKRVEAQVESQVPPAVRENYMKIVVSGMKYAMKDGANSIIASLKQSKDPLGDSVKGAINIVGLLRKAAKGTMPVNAMIPAAMTLLLQALDFADKTGILKVGQAEVDKATKMFMETILPLLNVPPEKMNAMMQQVHDLMRDPAKMAQLKEQQSGSAQLG